MLRSARFWIITQRVVTIPDWRFGITYLQGSRNPRRKLYSCIYLLRGGRLKSRIKTDHVSSLNCYRVDRTLFSRMWCYVFLETAPFLRNMVTKKWRLGWHRRNVEFCRTARRQTPEHSNVALWTPRKNTDVTFFNLLKTKSRLLYLKTQFVPRSKHLSSQL